MKRFLLKKFKKSGDLFIIIILIVTAFVAVGCGGGSDDTGGDGPPHGGLQEGFFLDSAVEGLQYKTETQSGITDENGIFMYLEGETVTFSLGNIVLGSTNANSIITPIDLVAGATDETNPTVTQICMFLQSLDNDGTVENGIQISSDDRNKISIYNIHFTENGAFPIEDIDDEYWKFVKGHLFLISGGNSTTMNQLSKSELLAIWCESASQEANCGEVAKFVFNKEVMKLANDLGIVSLI